MSDIKALQQKTDKYIDDLLDAINEDSHLLTPMESQKIQLLIARLEKSITTDDSDQINDDVAILNEATKAFLEQRKTQVSEA